VGDICLRFYGEDGLEISDPAGTRVIGLDLETLKKIPRAVGIAGGKRKVSAILGALRGKHINLLVTDQYTAERLIRQA
jgi:DNA-binding transcriptional regulator LsrR (DeoR family)